MKKTLSLFLLVLLVSICLVLSVSAASNNCVKITFTKMPAENSGWISVNAYTGKLQEGDILSVNVYNAGHSEFYCFLSTREGENWNTVGMSDFVYIEPGTSETVEINGITADAVWYLLELRELSEDTVIYLQGDAKVDYASNLYPMSELVEGQYCTVSAAAFPEEREVAATEQPQPTAAAEPTPEETPVQSPLRTEAPIPTEVPQDSPSAGSFWLWSLAGAVVVAAAAVLVIVYIKNKKKRGNGQ